MQKGKVLITGFVSLFLAVPYQVWAVDNNDVQKESGGWK